MESPVHPAATSHQPSFITAPGETDVLMVVAAVVLLLAIVGFGLLYFKLYHLPAKYTKNKLQYEIVAALALLALLTHMHIFWVAALILALIDFPDFVTPANRIVQATERLAGTKPAAADQSPRHAPEGEPEAGDAERSDRSRLPWALRLKLLAQGIRRLCADAGRWWRETTPRLLEWSGQTKARVLEWWGSRK
jgi:hypothetical protein